MTIFGSFSTWLIGLGCALGVAGMVMLARAVRNQRRGRSMHGSMLGVTSLSAGAVLTACTGWLILPGTSAQAIEAVRTGALASGAVLAFYAMWLNDQRRRIDQERLQTEAERKEVEQSRLLKEREQLEHDRARVVHERFAKVIELLGNSADQSRVGGLTMLRGIAHSEPSLALDVLDQLCAYLRRPVDETDAVTSSRERHVRATAQRLLCELVSSTPVFERPPTLDLSGAALHELAVTGQCERRLRLGGLRLDGAQLTGRTLLSGIEADHVSLTGGRVGGVLDVTNAAIARFTADEQAEFLDRVSFVDVDLGPELSLTSVEFRGSVTFRRARLVGRVTMHGRFHQPLVISHTSFRAVESWRSDLVVLDLSRAEFGKQVRVDENVNFNGKVRLEGARFDGGLRWRPHRSELLAEGVRVRRGSEADLPACWLKHAPEDDPEYWHLTRGREYS